MPDTIDVYECDGCGACCRGLLIEADSVDVLREPRINDGLMLDRFSLPVIEATWCLNDKDRDDVGCRFLGDDNRCQIYATRPGTCVAFAAGSVKCQEQRRYAGLPALQPVARERTVLTELAAQAVEFCDEED